VHIDTPYYWMLLVLLVLGSGMGFTMSPATNSVMNSLPPERAGIGSAMNDTTRQLGGALGVAVLGSLMNGVYRASVNSVRALDGMSAGMMEEVRSSIQNAHILAQGLGADLREVVVNASSQAFVNGVQTSFFVASLVMLLASIIALKLLPSFEREKEARKERPKAVEVAAAGGEE